MHGLPNETLVKVSFRCKKEYKNKLVGAKCIVHISVGQEYHESEKFIATMDLVNQTFSSCLLVVCDTLQRHSLRIKAPDLTDDEAYKKASQLGDDWLERNKMAYSHLDIDLDILRWDEWLTHSHYGKYRKKIDDLYRKNIEYQRAIHSTINKFLTRQNLLDNQEAIELSEAYILEECPVLIPLWAETGAEFVIYPRARTEAMSSTYHHFLGKKNDILLEEVALKFNRRTIPKKLSFSCLR